MSIASLTCTGTCYSKDVYTEDHGTWQVAGYTSGIPAGSTVTIYYSFNGGAWYPIRATTTSSSGSFYTSAPVTSDGTYRWTATYGGSPTSTTTLAAPIEKKVYPATVYSRTSGNVTSTATGMSVWGTTRPLVAGRPVTIQRYVNGTWVDVGSTVTDADRYFRWTTSYGTNSLYSYTFRAKYRTQNNGWTRYSAPFTLKRVLPAPSVRLTDPQARGVLASKGIPVVSSGNCSNRYLSYCTGLDTIRTATVGAVIKLRDAGCAVTMTGGTEIGHATGTYSHFNGYKADVAMSSCITSWVTRYATSVGYPFWYLYPTMYYNEVDHWDLRVVE